MRITRLPSSQELQPGMRRALQLRALLPLDTLRVSVNRSLSHMRSSTLVSALVATVYVIIAYTESDMTNEDKDQETVEAMKVICTALACTQVVLSVIHYKAGLRIRQLRGLIFEESNDYSASLPQDSTFIWLLLEAVVLLLVVPPRLQTEDPPLFDVMLTLSFLRSFVIYRLWFAFSHVLEQRETFYW